LNHREEMQKKYDMNQLVINLTLWTLFIPLSGFAQSAYQPIREGNMNFKNNDFSSAEEFYRQSIRKDGSLHESAFNLGDALYRQGKYEDAARYFQQAANKTDNPKMKSEAYHNLGNALLKNKKSKEAIEAYKRALINNPKNEDSRYNLAYAMRQQKQQQQQKQENKEQKNQEQEKKQEEQQKEEQEQQEQEQEKEEQKQNQEKQEQQEQQEQKEQQQKQKQQQQLSREDAQRILEALNNKEKKVQEKLKKKKVKEVEVNIEKDW